MPGVRDSVAIQSFRRNLRKYMDEKFWSSVVAFHWMATFLDPSCKHLEFLSRTDQLGRYQIQTQFPVRPGQLDFGRARHCGRETGRANFTAGTRNVSLF